MNSKPLYTLFATSEAQEKHGHLNRYYGITDGLALIHDKLVEDEFARQNGDSDRHFRDGAETLTALTMCRDMLHILGEEIFERIEHINEQGKRK